METHMEQKHRIGQNDTPSKKLKLDDDSEITIVPVLADQYTKDCNLVPVYVAEITDKKETSRIVRRLQGVYPLSNLQHLKRVKNNSDRLQIIICTLEDAKYGEIEVTETLDTSLLLNDVNGLSDKVTLLKVPESPPLTRTQYDFGVKFWPQQFHENKHISKLLNNTIFSSIELNKHAFYMKEAIRIARSVLDQKQSCNANVIVGAVIVDPEEGKIIGYGFDQRNNHPLKHAVMVAIDDVAKSQGGGCWKVKDNEIPVENITNDQIQSDKIPYLCTNFDLYVTREPCLLCSMALTHSRIRRVFYGCTQANGCLGTLTKIHVERNLNHHYEVFAGLLHTKCKELERVNF